MQPTEVKAYECPTCGYLEKDLAKATEHIKIPLNSLPRGLIYVSPGGLHMVINSYMVIVREEAFDERHNYHFHQATIQDFGDSLKIWGYLEATNAKEVKDLFQRGKIHLLSEQEFTQFVKRGQTQLEQLRKDFAIEEFVRTTSELDILVSKREV